MYVSIEDLALLSDKELIGHTVYKNKNSKYIYNEDYIKNIIVRTTLIFIKLHETYHNKCVNCHSSYYTGIFLPLN